ncbi:MAG TPA: hypothetical protein VKR82_01250 [Candidatus Acidoferrales bacterium]|jgi:hypothetical protein|nr:hypothetical protein [Candidatus Acidoferrales bacterium]
MFSALILTISVIGAMHFGISYWRSLIAGMAAQPLSDRFAAFSGLDKASVDGGDFTALLSLNRLTPDLKRQPSSLTALRTYYAAASALTKLPALNQWAQEEMGKCARYVAVLVDQRLSDNLCTAAEIRSC